MHLHTQDHQTSNSENKDGKGVGSYNLCQGAGLALWDQQYLNNVENTTKNTVLKDSCFRDIVSFSPRFSMNLRTVFMS